MQAAGGQGSGWQDTEPWRHTQRWQGLPGGEKDSSWRSVPTPSGSGQLERAAIEVGLGQKRLEAPQEQPQGYSSYPGTVDSTPQAARVVPDRMGVGNGGPGTAHVHSAGAGYVNTGICTEEYVHGDSHMHMGIWTWDLHTGYAFRVCT